MSTLYTLNVCEETWRCVRIFYHMAWVWHDCMLLIYPSHNNTLCAEYFQEMLKKYICIFYHSSAERWHRQLKCFPMVYKDLLILHNHYHDSWWLDSGQSQATRSHDLGTVVLEYSSFSTGKVMWIMIWDEENPYLNLRHWQAFKVIQVNSLILYFPIRQFNINMEITKTCEDSNNSNLYFAIK